MKDYDVIVIGCGLAGLSTAFELVEKKKKVLLLEARDVVGGRTSSWVENGMKVESGLHRFLGFYNHLPDLIKRAGIKIDDMLIWEDEVEIRSIDGAQGVFGGSVFKPLKTIGGILGNNDVVNPLDKASLAKMFAVALKDFATDKASLDKISVLAYAKKHGVTDRAIHNVLIPLTAGLFFLPPEKYSMFVLGSFLGVPKFDFAKMRIGAFSGGMTEVMCNPIAKAIEKNGGVVEVNAKVESLLFDGDTVSGVIVGKKKILAEHVVLATSLGPAQRIIKGSIKNKWFKTMLAMPTMPAVTIQFELSKPSMDVDHTTFGPGTSWASFSEQSRTTFTHAKGRLSVILTPADTFLGMKSEKILQIVIEDGKKIGIDIEKSIKDFRVITEPEDFYALIPGTEKMRPVQKTPITGLTLAGDYTKQEYLATMEGAVLSGKLAAEHITASENG